MPNPIMDAIGQVGYALDTPGAYLRGALAGNPGTRASGQDLLSTYGLTDESDPYGGLKGFGAELVLDPLSLAGPALGAFKGIAGATKAGRALVGLGDATPLARRLGELAAGVDDPLDALRHSYRQGESANPLVRGLAGFLGDEGGALRPFQEIGQRTDPDYVNSLPWYHGTGTSGLTPELLDPMKTDPGGLFSRGIYKTASPELGHEYAVTRAEEGLHPWQREVANVAVGGAMRDPALASRLDASLGSLFQNSDFLRRDPSVVRYLQSLQPRRPGDFTRSFLNHGVASNPQDAELVAQALGQTGLTVPPVPRPTIYQAQTNLGKIADMDLPAPPDLFDALHSLTGGSNALGAGYLRELQSNKWPASRLFEVANPIGFPSYDPSAPDAMIQALRGAGYDALSHTGGLRAGGGRNLHQVLISLDPNDTISHVGRANQITRFDPQNIEELLRQFRGG